MRRIMMMAALAAMLVVSAIPVAFAQDRNDRQEDRFEEREERFEDNGFFFGGDRFFDEDDFFDEDGFFFGDGDRFDGDDFDGNNNDGNNNDGVSQEFDQEAESGDVDQSFNVSGTGDNSNQCVGINGTANTGNAQNQVGVLQYASEADEFEFEEIESNVTFEDVASTTTCDQQVNQAASAFGGK